MQWYNGNANLRPAAAPPPQLKIPAPGVISIICIISVCWLLSATQSRSAAVQFHIKLMQQVKLFSQELEPWMEALENIKIVSKICLYAHVTSVLFCSNSCKTRNMLDVHTWSFTGHLTLCYVLEISPTFLKYAWWGFRWQYRSIDSDPFWRKMSPRG